MPWSRIGIYTVLVAVALLYLLPIYVLAVTGLKSFTEVSLEQMWDPPSGFHFDSFRQAFEALDSNLANSFRMVIPATIISCLLGSINGYVLTKWRFRGSDMLFFFLLFGMFIPYQSILIPLVKTLQAIGVYGSLWGLVVTHVIYGIPITTLIFRNYYTNIPTELVEAARIDGASIFGIYTRILFPLSLPGFVVVAIWQFTSIWNDFLFAATVTSNPTIQPVTVALNNLAGSFIVEWNVQMAGALIAALPTLLIYVFLGRFFIRGLMAGALRS
ncbi:MAG TPA: carbohydrate ABC transporter permease [Dehalococcoidia bacterium]|nr:carbohydrate ABC transporter permease [Dehalococcoidia bacterium]